MNPKFCNKLFPMLRRLCGVQWQIAGESLFKKIKYGEIGSRITVEVNGNPSQIYFYLQSRFGWVQNEDGMRGDGYIVNIVESEHEITEVTKEFDSEYKSIAIQYPINPGEILNRYCNGWGSIKGTVVDNDGWFALRRKEAHEEISIIIECAKKAGIHEKMFLSFGGVLGYAIHGDFLANDDDVDISFLPVLEEEKCLYLGELKSAGMTESRMKGPEFVDGNTVWFSVGRKPISSGGVKVCNWFWFEHGGYWWHSKGTEWVDGSPSIPSAKGIPSRIFNGKLHSVNFGGNAINVPDNIGLCLDWWYPGWVVREHCSSRKTAILDMRNNSISLM